MADQNKFEQMLEKLIAEDKAGAEELFHEIVVEKSRDIYENLLDDDVEIDEADSDSEDKDVEEASKDDDEAVDEASKDDDEAVDEAKDEDEDVKEDFDLDEFEVEGEPEMGGDATDDMMGDIEGGDDMDMEPAGDEDAEDVEDRVTDLEDALDDLKAEFEQMMADQDGESDDEPADEPEMDMSDEEDEGEEEEEPEEEVAYEESDEVEAKATTDPVEQMREYVEKITPKMGETGTDSTKSPVAGANNMGGDASNLVQGGEEAGGKAQAPKEDNAGNVNVPGGKASKSMSNAKGHGAEKKGAGETGANTKSTIGS